MLKINTEQVNIGLLYDNLIGRDTIEKKILHTIGELNELYDVIENKRTRHSYRKYGDFLSESWYNSFYGELADCNLCMAGLNQHLIDKGVNGKKLNLSKKLIQDIIDNKTRILYKRIDGLV